MKNGIKIAAPVLFSIMLMSITAEAKFSERFRTDFEARYTPAIPHRGLDTAAQPLELDKARTLVVVKIGDVIPADRAVYFISPAEYDYRGAEVEDGKIKTRLGSIYTYLPRGTIMVLSGVVYAGNHIWLKLLSINKIPSDRNPKLKPTRVAVMLGFKIPQKWSKNMEMQNIFSMIEEWIEPFDSLVAANKYSQDITTPLSAAPPAQK